MLLLHVSAPIHHLQGGYLPNIQTTLEFGSCILMQVRKIAKRDCWLCHVSVCLST
jgi:hypothetical protein